MAKRRRKSKLPAKTTPDPHAVGEVLTLILQGKSEREILDEIASRWPDAAAQPLIIAAMTEIVKSQDASPEVVRAWCFEAARYVYAQAVAIGDYGSALRALKMVQESAG